MAGEKVLVVDDEPAVLHACDRALSRFGFAVQTAPGAAEAFAFLGTTTFDLLLTDIKMPDIDGLELLRRARQLDPQLVMVVLTGHGTFDLAIESIKQGVSGFVVKPFTLQELREAVVDALAKRRQAQASIGLKLISPLLEAHQEADEERQRVVQQQATRLVQIEAAVTKIGQFLDELHEASRTQAERAPELRAWPGGSVGMVQHVAAGCEPAWEPGPGGLTRREREVLQLVARGRTNPQIARELYITEHTTKEHLAKILRKLELANRVQLAAWAVQHGLTTA
jgi:DNA-binding NarL/FixJ family response regulator